MGAPHLAGDLAFADHHGLETGGNGQEVTHGLVAFEGLKGRVDLRSIQWRSNSQGLYYCGTGTCGVEGVYVDLEPVAGGEHNGTSDGGGDHNRLTKLVGANT